MMMIPQIKNIPAVNHKDQNRRKPNKRTPGKNIKKVKKAKKMNENRKKSNGLSK